MRFNEKRASAFGEYVITAMLETARKKKKPFITITKREFSKILNTQKLRPEHIDFVRSVALEEGVAMANMGHTLVFFYFEDIEKLSMSLPESRGVKVTNAFEKVYGSDAADLMWEEETYPS